MRAPGYARSPGVLARRVGKCFGAVELAACKGGVHHLIQAGIGYLGLDLLANLFGCVDPALRQR
jgi:hypothetical protein